MDETNVQDEVYEFLDIPAPRGNSDVYVGDRRIETKDATVAKLLRDIKDRLAQLNRGCEGEGVYVVSNFAPDMRKLDDDIFVAGADVSFHFWQKKTEFKRVDERFMAVKVGSQ